jgi:hypothetical protein
MMAGLARYFTNTALDYNEFSADRDLFGDTVDDHLTDAIYTIRQWVRSYRPIIYRSRREAQHRSISTLKILPIIFIH